MTTMANTRNINSRMFNSFSNKYNDTEDIVKIPRSIKQHNDVNNEKCLKTQKSRSRDGRYAYKNRRTINKDWKDFNNSS